MGNSAAIVESLFPSSLIGRDEMNLAEFPIALLTDRAAKGQKTLYFEDGHGRLTVTGSDAFGLPTAVDTDVIVALIYLTKQRTNFKDAKVNFSFYELIRLLNWPDDGKSYQRLKASFSRWVGVSLHYDKCWWNNRLKAYTDAQIHIIESVELLGREAIRKSRSAEQMDLEFSHFTWNRKFIESCQADNLRQLDLDTYFSLKSAVSKRLYRFLGKRFYLQADWTFDLKEIAFERVGLSRSYASDAGKIKEKIQPAIDELEAIGFLQPANRDDRYTRLDRGRWTIRLARRSPALARQEPASPAPAVEVDSPQVAELVRHGVTRSKAVELVETNPSDRIATQLEILAWFLETKPEKIADPAAWLVTAIRGDHAAPKGFVTAAERRRIAEAKANREQVEQDARRRKQQEAAEDRAVKAKINAYRKSLSPDQLAQAEADAIAEASEETRRTLADPVMRQIRGTLVSQLLNEHLGRLLETA